ncbi:polysaccharide lyase family 8 super-sandwich domain-containing protein [Flavobacterium sp. JAS]|uniref:polysaccharide lyase family 8 super-sandwich domain-containing protein n=1 Tax=Flavobacterium sp. JAS TaxID=2897329 RepID=UPI001E4C8F21|nr:polysaccharide lyase family 8 super-sandwich domain-containing protein [Flavobacterium sp. JAS]MCD0468794.1 polysaccharide lyase beta-sandwich domain-containing protein [Flavobacterium sp. JAS]
MKKIKLWLIFFIVFTNTVAANTSDFITIYNRMYNEYLSNPSASSVETILKKMTSDGSFDGIDYKTKDDSPRSHPIMLATLAAAYKNPQNKYFSNPDVKAKYLLGLKFWIETNQSPSNWWFRYIAYPKEVTKSVILMRDELKADKILFDNTIKYLRWSYENANAERMTGANGCDIIMGAMAASVMTENKEQMLDYKAKMTNLLSMHKQEGIEADYMYGQHSGNGRQLYLGNYGKEYINSALYYLEFCNNTAYNSPGISLLEDFYIKGIQWIFFSKNYDPNQAGRFNSSDKYCAQFESMTKRFLNLNTPRKAEIKKVYDRIKGENSLSGNRMFWRFDYMINRRENYMSSTRMSSTRTVGAEAGNGDGEYNYYSGNGTNYIFVTGKEYNGQYFKVFNNRQFPGITAEQDIAPLPIPNWGENAGNGNSYAGGVSDNTYGACGMILERHGITAHKSWFYFDDEFVCLGAGINQTNGKAPVYTTLNQCNSSGKAQYSVKGEIADLNTSTTIIDPDWILNGNIGYFNLEPNSNYILANDSNLFSANINHGINPANKSYAYLVKPSLQSSKEAAKYSKKIPVSVLSNNEQIQAIRHQNLNIVEIMFYQPGTLKISEGESITVDKPCALIWKEKTNEISVANPYCESENPKEINVNVSKHHKISQMTFQMPTGVNTGSSVTQKITGLK